MTVLESCICQPVMTCSVRFEIDYSGEDQFSIGTVIK